MNFVDSAANVTSTDADLIKSIVVYSKSKFFISEYLAQKNHEQTMFLFCELTSRFEYCPSHQARVDMLNILVPWFYHLELVDTNVVISADSKQHKIKSPNETDSMHATEIILNNLFYLSCKFGDQYSNEFELLWAILASTQPNNLKIITHYLFVMISLATYEVLTYAKRIICYLAKVSQERCIDELINELEIMETFCTCIEKNDSQLPFYRYTHSMPHLSSTLSQSKVLAAEKLNSFVDEEEENDDDEDDDDEDDSLDQINKSDFNDENADPFTDEDNQSNFL